MKFRLVLGGFVLLSVLTRIDGGVKELSPEQEAQVLALWRNSCPNGPASSDTDGPSSNRQGGYGSDSPRPNHNIYCKFGEDIKDEGGVKKVVLQSDTPRKPLTQVIFIEPPTTLYRHHINVQQEQEMPRKIAIYVLPTKSEHKYEYDDQRQDQKPVKPIVYFLKGDPNTRNPSSNFNSIDPRNNNNNNNYNVNENYNDNNNGRVLTTNAYAAASSSINQNTVITRAASSSSPSSTSTSGRIRFPAESQRTRVQVSSDTTWNPREQESSVVYPKSITSTSGQTTAESTKLSNSIIDDASSSLLLPREPLYAAGAQQSSFPLISHSHSRVVPFQQQQSQPVQYKTKRNNRNPPLFEIIPALYKGYMYLGAYNPKN